MFTRRGTRNCTCLVHGRSPGRLTRDSQVVSLEIFRSSHSRFSGRLTRDSQVVSLEIPRSSPSRFSGRLTRDSRVVSLEIPRSEFYGFHGIPWIPWNTVDCAVDYAVDCTVDRTIDRTLDCTGRLTRDSQVVSLEIPRSSHSRFPDSRPIFS